MHTRIGFIVYSRERPVAVITAPARLDTPTIRRMVETHTRRHDQQLVVLPLHHATNVPEILRAITTINESLS